MTIEDIEDVERLRKINRALMTRVESAMDQQGNAFSLFQTAINLEGQVRQRTDELSTALHRVERANHELASAKDTADKANLAKTRFLAAASHDVLQPLNAALLTLSVLSDMQETEAGKLLALQIERSLESMHELLRTLLDISKLDAGVVLPKVEAIPISDMLERIASDLGPSAREKGLDIRFRCKDQAVFSDKTMLRRILQNLVSNAIKYTQSGGVVVRVRETGSEIALDVVDTGPGIPADQHEAIFEEFHRGALPAGHDRNASSGLGLGLSIVRRAVTTLGHRLNLRSVEGRGTRFTVVLPRAERKPGLPAEGIHSQRTGASKIAGTRLLYIENDPASAAAGKRLFDSWSCDTRIAATVEQAEDQLQNGQWEPEVIIADLHLDAGKRGTQAVIRVRNCLERAVPAIIVTADPSAEAEREIRSNNMELMHKPLRPARLRALLSHQVSAG